MKSELDWYKNAVFYEVYVRAFYDSNSDGHGDLQGLIQKLDYIKKLGVDCIWLLPTNPSPLKDDGYDVADYYGILKEYGSLQDFRLLVEEIHQRGLKVITDLVLNHTSDQHPWFQKARSDQGSPYHDYYVWSDTDKKFTQARIIFLDTEHSNWTWDEAAGKYFWHRFYSSQPDLNYDNPQVQEEMLNIMQYWLELGIDGFRVDAVPYLYEREGTNCENLPETHAYLKRIRRFVDENYPDRILLCEANQWPEDVRHYFGNGDEFHMGFHFPVMPRIFMAIGKEKRDPLVWILERTPPIPTSTQWVTFLRNHDELTLEMVTEDERDWMWQRYAPDPRMRLNLGIRRRLAPLLEGDQRKIELAYSLLFSLPGSPTIYYGDEIGMGDNIYLPDRDGLRTPMQWDDGTNAGFSDAEADRLFSPVIDDPIFGSRRVNAESQIKNQESLLYCIREMIAVRKAYPAFGSGKFEWVPGTPESTAVYIRTYQQSSLLILNNLSAQSQLVEISTPDDADTPEGKILLENKKAKGEVIIDGAIVKVNLKPYEYLWLK